MRRNTTPVQNFFKSAGSAVFRVCLYTGLFIIRVFEALANGLDRFADDLEAHREEQQGRGHSEKACMVTRIMSKVGVHRDIRSALVRYGFTRVEAERIMAVVFRFLTVRLALLNLIMVIVIVHGIISWVEVLRTAIP